MINTISPQAIQPKFGIPGVEREERSFSTSLANWLHSMKDENEGRTPTNENHPASQPPRYTNFIKGNLWETLPLFQQPVASPQLLTQWVRRLAVESAFHDIGKPGDEIPVMKHILNTEPNLPPDFREHLVNLTA